MWIWAIGQAGASGRGLHRFPHNSIGILPQEEARATDVSDSPHVLNRSPWSRHKRRGWSVKERGRGARNTSFLSHGPWKASFLGNYWCYCHEGRAQNGQGSITVSAARGGGLIREGWQDAVEGVWRPLRFIKVMAYVFVKVHLPSRVKPERGNMLLFSLQGFKALIYSWWS